MPATQKPKRKTRADLEREVMELRAQIASVYHFASLAVGKASTDHLAASACVVRLTALGGREIIEPVAIKDGLSAETIAALRADMARSYELATMYTPKATRKDPAP